MSFEGNTAKGRNVVSINEGMRVDRTGGGGDDGDMEQRLSEVEKAVIRIDTTLSHMSETMDRVSKEVSTFKWQVLAAGLAILLASVATAIGIQQMTVSTFQAAAQASAEAKGSVTVQPQQPPTIIVVPTQPQAPATPR